MLLAALGSQMRRLLAARLALEDALRVPVDLITSGSNDRAFLESIAKEEVPLYREA